MTQSFGLTSEKHLIGVHPDLVRLVRFVNQTRQCTILGGLRTLDEQRVDIAKGLSHTLDSKHLIQSDGFGHALDLAPDPVDFKRVNYNLDLIYFMGYVKHCAEYLGIKIRYGGDWNRNNEVSDESFKDLDHIELDAT